MHNVTGDEVDCGRAGGVCYLVITVHHFLEAHPAPGRRAEGGVSQGHPIPHGQERHAEGSPCGRLGRLEKLVNPQRGEVEGDLRAKPGRGLHCPVPHAGGAERDTGDGGAPAGGGSKLVVDQQDGVGTGRGCS